MSWTVLAAGAAMIIPPATAAGPAAPSGWTAPPPAVASAAAPLAAPHTEISVLTYNVRGLPWPIASGRAKALRAIGDELARLRKEGRQPDVVLIQEGFRAELGDLVRRSGYAYWAQGPKRGQPPSAALDGAGPGWRAVRYPLKGEGWGKLTGSGLHVLSDLPITDVEGAVYRHCAGFDCLGAKGVMLARVKLPDGQEIDVVNTHLNTKTKAGVPRARTLRAYQLQTDELLAFLARHAASGRPMVIGGDFNMRHSPDRYAYRAAARPYAVVAEFCGQAAAACQGYAPPAAAKPWLGSQDLQAFAGTPASQVRPIQVGALFAGKDDGGVLSDHVGYVVRYRLSPGSVGRSIAAGTAPATPAGRVLRASLIGQRPE